MRLRLDHLIIRAADPAGAMAELAGRAGMPVLAEVESVGGLSSGLVRAGPVDIEVLAVGSDGPAWPQGYGIGLVADVGLDAAVAGLRALGLATSPAVRGVAGEGAQRRTWRAAQVKGLLPEPFPAPASTGRPGRLDRVLEAGAGAVGRIPAVARAATRRAGRSMVVVTEYDFDAEAWRAEAGAGPAVVEAHLGTAGHRAAWSRLPLAPGGPLRLHDAGPSGIARVVLDGAPPGARAPFAIGDVAFEWRGPG